VPALYIVATPIGNLEDISLRAIRILNQVKLIAAEDTRTTKHLLDTYNIKSKLTSYYEYNKNSKLKYLIEFLSKEDVALVSEAGMPGLSDTGYELVTEAIKNNIPIIAIPGASALLTALVVSGLPIGQFIYLGFLPRQKSERRKLFLSILNELKTIIFFESPHRLIKSLHDARDILGDRHLAVCRELTKLYEEVFRGSFTEAIEHFSEPRGEFTLVIEGSRTTKSVNNNILMDELRRLKMQGVSAKDAIKIVSEINTESRNKLYNIWLNIK
jgi:16S rRNA (cytidine1402-2'-O)-methyltransferase